ncbi:MAG TPA: hypothetical protein VHH32_07875 [Gemmatimonadales bacterium]|nr:hypothetical protein [Gemmatimonadales bacterium]
MKSSFIGAALVGVLNAGVSFAGSPEPADGMPGLFATGSSANAEGGVGGEGVRVASALAAASRFLSDDRQSLFVAVGEGGEGGEGGRGKRRVRRGLKFHPGDYHPSYRDGRYFGAYGSYPPRYRYSAPYQRPCRTLSQERWDPVYGWVVRRETICGPP